MHIVDNASFKPYEDIETNKEYGAPCQKGFMTFELDERGLALLNEIDQGRGEGLHAEYVDRSTYSQVGLNTLHNMSLMRIMQQRNAMELPCAVVSLRKEPWLSIIKRNRTRMGRLLFYTDDEVLNGGEVEEAWKGEKSLWLPEKTTIEEDGTTYVPILPEYEFHLDPYQLKDESDLMEVLQHGRGALTRRQAVQTRGVSQVLKPKQYRVSAMRISTGPHTAVIRRQINDVLEHLGAVALDSWRSTRIRNNTNGEGRGYTERQAEIVNIGDEPVSIEELCIPMKFLRPSAESKELFQGFTPDTRVRIHEEGTNFSDLVELSEPNCERWFRSLSNHPYQGGTGAIIVTRKGTTPVSFEPDNPNLPPCYAWYKKRLKDEAQKGERQPSQEYKELYDQLWRTAANGRMLISHHLPSPAVLEALSDEMVKTFLFRGMMFPQSLFQRGGEDPRSQSNFYLSEEKHRKMMELEQQGCEFIWWPHSERGNEAARVFYKGLFVLPESKDRYDRFRKEATGIAMFGSSATGLEHALEEPIRRFGRGLADVFGGKGEVGIFEGAGPGVMEMAREMAEENGFFNASVGMDFEQVEKPNFASDAVVFFQDDKIEYRQTLMQRMLMIPAINIGSIGTNFERVLAILKAGLSMNLPAPILLIDPTGAPKHFWKPSVEQMDNMLDKAFVGKPLIPDWKRNILELVSSYEEALEVIDKFVRDPFAFWEEKGIPMEEIEKAYRNHCRAYQDMQIALPSYMEQPLRERFGKPNHK